MATPSVRLNGPGVRALLRSPEVARDLQRRGLAIANAAGPGHEVQTRRGRNRVWVTVRTATWRARANQRNVQSLTRALHAGR